MVGNREVVIISNKHPTISRSIFETFGAENHAYCYRHLKENLVLSLLGITPEETRVKKCT